MYISCTCVKRHSSALNHHELCRLPDRTFQLPLEASVGKCEGPVSHAYTRAAVLQGRIQAIMMTQAVCRPRIQL